MESHEFITDVINEVIKDLGLKDCYITHYNHQITVHRIIDIYVRLPPGSIESCERILTYTIKGTALIDSYNMITDLSDPDSILQLKADIGLSYDLFGGNIWKAFLKLPWSTTKYFWRLRKQAYLEIKEGIKNRMMRVRPERIC